MTIAPVFLISASAVLDSQHDKGQLYDQRNHCIFFIRPSSETQVHIVKKIIMRKLECWMCHIFSGFRDATANESGSPLYYQKRMEFWSVAF